MIPVCFYPWIEADSSKGKVYGTKSGGNQVQASKGLLLVESYRMPLTPPGMNCDCIREMFTKDTCLSLKVQFSLGIGTENHSKENETLTWIHLTKHVFFPSLIDI